MMRATTRERPDATIRRSACRRGMLLVAVLAIITVLALLGASFSFQMNADLAGMNALRDMQQARLACDSAIDRVILLLRESRNDMDEWYNHYELFRRQLVWAKALEGETEDQEGGSKSLADQEKIEGRPAWRFSVVSYKRSREGTGSEVEGDDADMRYGITDESSKINLNAASRGQLLRLFDQFETEHVTSQELADALIDWRDSDDVPISEFGAESSYYLRLEPAYRAKNRPLETVEELLMIRGFDGQLLYGEDYNRNGWLDDNEDDGEDGAFPPDDGDGKLDRGLLPFVTVYSWNWNWTNENKQRVNINTVKFSDEQNLPETLVDELRWDIIEFIADAQGRGYKFRSVGELLGLNVYEDGTSDYDEVWAVYAQKLAESERIQEVEEGEEETGEEETTDEGEVEEEGRTREGDAETSDRDKDDKGKAEESTDEEEDESSRGRRDETKRKNKDRTKKAVDDGDDAAEDADRESTDRETGDRRTSGGRSSDRGRGDSRDRGSSKRGDDKDASGVDAPTSGGDTKKAKGTPITSPVSPQDMVLLMDRLTVTNEQQLRGLINVNTASPVVLRTIVGLSEEHIEAIASRRTQLAGAEKMTTAWLVSSGTLDAPSFAVVSNKLTSRSIQFSMDVLGFADHVGTVKRFQATVEMRGQLAQMLYYRDITSLGIGYPVWDDERSEGLGFSIE